MNYMKTYFTYRSPPVGFVEDRDFFMSQEVFIDYPEPGMQIAVFKSIEDDRIPHVKGKVRATVHLIGILTKPDKDPKTGEDLVHMMMLTNVDINGLIPKWMVNIAAKQAP
jgi:hypothetical protein